MAGIHRLSRVFVAAFILAILFIHRANAQDSVQSGAGNKNSNEAAVIPGDFADPSVIRVGSVYYAAGTSSEWAPHYPLFTSDDLLHWKSIGFVLKETPSWASSSFWAPELYYRNGTYYVYYVARKKADGISCIGVATSKDPKKGFTDRGIVLEYGKEAIDPFVIEEAGKLYMTFKAYGLDQRPIELLAIRLSADGLKTEGETFSLMRDDKREGLEGQCLVRRNGYYYLLTSIGNCCGANCSYQVEVSRSRTLKGPYTKFSGNPVLSETAQWKCSGHGTVVTKKDGRMYYMYHAYSKADNVYTGRQGMLAEMTWDNADGWPKMKPVWSSNTARQHFRDDFTSTSLSDRWQWDFRHAQPKISLDNSALVLTGAVTDDNATGTALTVRPYSGNYEIETEIPANSNVLQGLVLYGDASQAIGIAVISDTVQVWQVNKEGRTVLNQERLHSNGAVKLTMHVENGYELHFYFSESAGDWKELKAGSGQFFNGNFLPPWDRSPRPGLLQRGAAPAVFNYFELR